MIFKLNTSCNLRGWIYQVCDLKEEPVDIWRNISRGDCVIPVLAELQTVNTKICNKPMCWVGSSSEWELIRVLGANSDAFTDFWPKLKARKYSVLPQAGTTFKQAQHTDSIIFPLLSNSWKCAPTRMETWGPNPCAMGLRYLCVQHS